MEYYPVHYWVYTHYRREVFVNIIQDGVSTLATTNMSVLTVDIYRSLVEDVAPFCLYYV